MRLSILIFTFLLVSSCSNTEIDYLKKIDKELNSNAISHSKILKIDSLAIISIQPITFFEVIKKQVYHLKRIKSNIQQIIALYEEKKGFLLKDKNEINHLYPSPKDKSKLDYLITEIRKCDSLITENQIHLDKVQEKINTIMIKDYSHGYDKQDFFLTTYYFKALVNKNYISDTFEVFISKDLETYIDFANVLFTPNGIDLEQ